MLPGHEQANTVLTQLALQQEAQHASGSMTTDYRAQDFFALPHPVVDWMRTCINKSVGDFLAACTVDYDVRWSLQGWFNINRRGDYHNLHNHPRSYLSGTYYIAMPEHTVTGGSDSTRDDLNPGAISFFDPRGAVNMSAIAKDGEIDPEFRLTPAPGTILLWPSFMQHAVHPNLSDEMRISLSFNVILNWQDHYLPN
jgi:uncharacterized protein (TIGR02466 family)